MASKVILKYSFYCTKVEMESFVLLVGTFFELSRNKEMHPAFMLTLRKLLNLLKTSSMCPIVPKPARKYEKKENK